MAAFTSSQKLLITCDICNSPVRNDRLQKHRAKVHQDKIALAPVVPPRARQIQQYCLERAIPSLVHFTRLCNLPSILQRGLLSRLTLEKSSSAYCPVFNDLRRLDQCTDAICFSIAFPNYKMFYRYSMDKRSDWVVIVLN